MTEDDLKKFLEENKADIQAKVKQRLIDGLLANQQWTMQAHVSDIVSEFIKNEIAPLVRAHLESEKGAILQAAIEGTAEIGEMLSKAMIERAAKNISANSYNFRETMKAIFE